MPNDAPCVVARLDSRRCFSGNLGVLPQNRKIVQECVISIGEVSSMTNVNMPTEHSGNGLSSYDPHGSYR